MIRVLSIFGTRPEAIKMAPLLRELQGRSGIASRVCVTAQHRELLDQVLSVFGITPDFDLDLMLPDQSPSELLSRALPSLDFVIRTERPDLVLVHGDTTSCLAGALAAFYRQVPLGHVEAGLRSCDKAQPFPEEMNRQLTDRLSDLLFAPTEQNRQQLLWEGIPKERVFVTGNTVVDALRTTSGLGSLPVSEETLAGKRLIVLTAHRRENFGPPLRHIFSAAKRLAATQPELLILCPLHPNPAVRAAASELSEGCPNLLCIEPPEPLAFHALLRRAELILTDSGGVQEEAAALGKPTLVLRETTERQEGLAAGCLRLVGTDGARVVRESERLLRDRDEYARMSAAPNPFGDGHAAERIADLIEETFGAGV